MLGREFPLGLVDRVWQHPHPRVTALSGKEASDAPLALSRDQAGEGQPELERLLSRLQLSEFIYEQPALSDIEYVFKHALTQEVAYNSLLSERRKLLHERAGAVMEALYASRIDDYLSELARHYERSGNAIKAVEYLERAGIQAMSRASQAEAITLFTSALELLKTLPQASAHLIRELTLQLGLGSALQAIKGFSAAEVGQAFERTYELCQSIEATPERLEALAGLAVFYLVRLELRRAYQLAQELVGVAEQGGDTDSLLKGHTLTGMTLCIMGEHLLARRHLERAESLYSHAKRSLYGPSSFCFEATTLACMGYVDQAVDHCHRGIALAREQPDPYTLVGALNQAAIFQAQRREGERSLETADEMLQVSM
ncbi:MAG: hypothetical protein JO071_07595 [Deltaproteobacteria bacterium]|nr:hypothetical protein [Deltaproteobacteria bacterium]